jgi:hypothetical protein
MNLDDKVKFPGTGHRLDDVDAEPIKKKSLKKTKKTKVAKKTKGAPKEVSHEFYILDDIVYFELKGRANGSYAMVSMNKWPTVSKYEWYLGKAGYPICYELHKMQLHRLVYTLTLGFYPPSELYIDHIDRNKLNNSDENLRPATAQENSFNKTTDSNKKGVKKISENNYSATVVKDGVRHEIKNIPSETQAAQMYNLMAEELFGSFAAPNKIDNEF